MRSTQHDLASLREELVSIERGFTRLQTRIEAVGILWLTCLFG
jgi:hypothetical protein